MKRFIWIGMLLVFAGVLLSLNQIVGMSMPEEVRIEKTNWDQYLDLAPAYAEMSEWEYDNSGLLEYINCRGWAYSGTGETVKKKRGYLVLKGQKGSYRTSECQFRKGSLGENIKGWHGVEADEAPYFELTFSTVSLPSDYYEMYFYVIENETNERIVDLGSGFYKNGIHVENFIVSERVKDIDTSQIYESFTDKWYSFNKHQDSCSVEGWQMIDGKDSEKTQVYVFFRGDNEKSLVVKAPSRNILALSEKFGDVQYIRGGFGAYVMNENLPDNKGVFYIVSENEGKWYRTEESAYEVD